MNADTAYMSKLRDQINEVNKLLKEAPVGLQIQLTMQSPALYLDQATQREISIPRLHAIGTRTF